jgi:hypothetical protein
VHVHGGCEMSPVLIARDTPRCVGNCHQSDYPCTSPELCGRQAEMACTAGDDETPLTRAESATLLIVIAAFAGAGIAVMAFFVGWLVG